MLIIALSFSLGWSCIAICAKTDHTSYSLFNCFNRTRNCNAWASSFRKSFGWRSSSGMGSEARLDVVDVVLNSNLDHCVLIGEDEVDVNIEEDKHRPALAVECALDDRSGERPLHCWIQEPLSDRLLTSHVKRIYSSHLRILTYLSPISRRACRAQVRSVSHSNLPFIKSMTMPSETQIRGGSIINDSVANSKSSRLACTLRQTFLIISSQRERQASSDRPPGHAPVWI